MQSGEFYLVALDHDRNLFNVIGPMTDDCDWQAGIAKSQEAGRNIQYVSIPVDDGNRLTIRRNVENSAELKYVEQSVLSESPDAIED